MILGLGCESGVGKDTFTMFLIDHLRSRKIKSLNIIREGFADRLYDTAHSFYKWAGFKTRMYYALSPSEKNVILPLLGKSPRQLLIELSNVLTAYDPHFALNAVVKDTDFHLKIIPDLRRPVEFNALYNTPDTYLLRITHPRIDSQIEMDIELKSEPRWHETICNSGTLNDLNAKAVEFAERVVLPRLYNFINRSPSVG